VSTHPRGAPPPTNPPPVRVPPLLRDLVDDAAVFPPGSATLPDAVAAHLRHRSAWYAPMVGPLLLPPSDVDGLAPLLASEDALTVALVGPLDQVQRAAEAVTAAGRVTLAHVESPVGKRGEDPLPGLRALLSTGLPGYAEVPLTLGLLAALDQLARARHEGAQLAAKFRTGGLAAELFPTPIELAAVICACRDRELPFKLTAGLHHAIRRTEPETGFVHHGFLNVLAAALQAAAGAEPDAVAETVAGTDPVPLVEAVRAALDRPRPLWKGFGSCSIAEPLADLQQLGMLGSEAA
jgi:hypothetical protein